MVYPNGTVTFLFTDIEGSTKLAQQYPESMPALLARHNEILNQAIKIHNGYVFQIVGDSFAVSFHTATDASNAALQAQRDLQNENWQPVAIKVRMGIHTGAAHYQIDNKENPYSGYAALAMTQRIMSAGHGGQILLSQSAHDLTRDRLPETAELIDMGERRLKDILRLEQIFQLRVPDLHSDFPALKTLDTHLNNLPTQLTPFVGREREISAVLGLLGKPGVRLVTLTGAGGTGKTRLSIQVATELLDEYENGVWFVDLASISDPKLVLSVVASTLKVRVSAGVPIEAALQDHLHDRCLLLVIDNFEQVVSAAPVIGKLLAAAPKIKVLTSSREVLHLRGEHDYPVPPLGLPESKRKQTAAVMAQYEAVALFIQHAQAANPVFELNEQNASIVAEICTRLDGLPLAIELAAARSRLLKPEAMLEKLNSRLNLLTGGLRDLPHRQQTIRGAIDWSYDLLDESEKILFARLGVFVGGWTMESAEAVCSSGLGMDVLTGLESLFDKSLIRQFDGRNGAARFTMLETIREYAMEKLTQNGEFDTIQQARTNYMDVFLEKVRSALSSTAEPVWFANLDDELDNLRASAEWALTYHQLSLIVKIAKLFEYWEQRVINIEPLGWLERSLAFATDIAPQDHARVRICAGNLSNNVGNSQRAMEYYESALDLIRDVDDPNGIAICLNNLGNIAMEEKNFEKARQLYERCLVEGSVPNSWGHSMVLNNLGSLARVRGDWQVSKDYYMNSLKICEQLGAEAGISYVHAFLGILALVQGEINEAKIHFEIYLNASWTRANPLFREVLGYFQGYVNLLLGNNVGEERKIDRSIEAMAELLDQGQTSSSLPFAWLAFEGCARRELMNGRAERAAQFFGAAWSQRRKDDCLLTEFERPGYESVVASARSAIGDDFFDQAFAKGMAMTLEQTVKFALEIRA